MVAAASTASSGPHTSAYGANPRVSSSARPTKPAALDTTERYAATGTGAPA